MTRRLEPDSGVLINKKEDRAKPALHMAKMRTVQLIRIKSFISALVSIQVRLDGTDRSVMTLKNGKRLLFTLDEQAHTIELRSGKSQNRISVPAGTADYNFQIEPLDGPEFIYRCCNGDAILTDPIGIRNIGILLTYVLLDPRFREKYFSYPDPEIEVDFGEEQWTLRILSDGCVMKSKEYAHYRQNGKYALANAITQDSVREQFLPENRSQNLEILFEQYLCMIPGFQRTGENKGKLVPV